MDKNEFEQIKKKKEIFRTTCPIIAYLRFYKQKIKIMVSIKIEIKSWKKTLLFFLIIGIIAAGVYWTTRWVIPTQDLEITDDLGGNIFPSAILSTATTDAMIIKPTIKNYLGNPKSGLALKINSPSENCRIQVTVAETPFYRTSVSEFVLQRRFVLTFASAFPVYFIRIFFISYYSTFPEGKQVFFLTVVIKK